MNYGATSLQQPPAPHGHTRNGLEENNKLIHVLMDELSTLEGVLNPVLLPDGPRATDAQSGPQAVPVKCSIAAGIDELNTKLRSQVERVRAITSRVDL